MLLPIRFWRCYHLTNCPSPSILLAEFKEGKERQKGKWEKMGKKTREESEEKEDRDARENKEFGKRWEWISTERGNNEEGKGFYQFSPLPLRSTDLVYGLVVSTYWPGILHLRWMTWSSLSFVIVLCDWTRFQFLLLAVATKEQRAVFRELLC